MSEIRSQATPARDELGEAIKGYGKSFLGECEEVDVAKIEHSFDCMADGLADYLTEDDGWSKPRTVNSIEEALTLPQGTVIRPGPIVWPRSGEISVNISDQRHYVHWTGSDCPDELATWMLPFAVLFAPGGAG